MARASGKPAYGEGRQALIRTAVRLVAREGLGKLTYRSLAADAGVTVGAVQHNFRSMNDVLESALEFCMEKSREHSRNVRTVTEFIEIIADFIRDEPELQAFSVEIFLAARHIPSLSAIVDRHQEAYRQLNRDVLEASNIDYDESLVELIMATVDGIAFQAVIFKEGQQDRTGKQLDALKWAIASYGRNSMGDCSGRSTVRDDQCRCLVRS